MGLTAVLLVCTAIAAGSAQNVVVPCMTTREECSGLTSGLMIYGNQYFCCGAGFNMQSFNNNCTCVQVAEVLPCNTGVPACRDASGISSFNGNVYCCPSGFSMQASGSWFNGGLSPANNCACLRWFGNSMGGSVVIGDFNSTALNMQMSQMGQNLRDWGNRFGAAMADWGRRFGQRMQNMGRRMARMWW